MSPLKLKVFGKRNVLSSSDTPVTQLSKILSKTSANQEPPISSFTNWFDGTDTISQYPSSSKPTQRRESTNSCSSGYFSSSASQSAPPTCNIERVSLCLCPITLSYQVASFPHQCAELTHPGFFSHQRLPLVDTNLDNYSTYRRSPTLRRTQSCATRNWLTKRHRRQAWPRISGISKSASGSMSPSHITDTNSCPAAFSAESCLIPPGPINRFSLPPLGESAHSSSSDGSPDLKNKFVFSPMVCPTPTSMDCSFDFSARPHSKKMRLDTSNSDAGDENIPLPNFPRADLDSTLPLKDHSMEHEEEPNAVVPNYEQRHKPLFEILRHHSTPMVSARSNIPFAYPAVPSPLQEEPSSKQVLQRCASVPTQTIFEKFNRCISVLDNPSVHCDDRRPRALPVLQRTDSGLHCVSVDTVADLLQNGPQRPNLNFIIVDCRYPYEYDGGHIEGAVNVFTHSDAVQEIYNRVPAQRPPDVVGPPKLLGDALARRLAVALKEPLSAPCEAISDDDDEEEDDDGLGFGHFTSDASRIELALAAAGETEDVGGVTEVSSPSEPNLSGSSGHSDKMVNNHEPTFAIIFHCEFSSKRAPDLAMFLRSVDRLSNYHRYPFLYFPEIYIMKGGYSAFYQKYSQLCSPDDYLKMSDPIYQTDYRLYRRLTKRVSSACTVCLRPQQNAMFESECSHGVNHMNSFGQPTDLISHGAAVQPVGHHVGATMPNDEEIDKENMRPTYPVAHIHSVESRNKCSPHQSICEPFSSPNNENSLSSYCSSTSSVFGNSPFQIAEAVVRAGRRVIASTLRQFDAASGELGRLFDKYRSHLPPLPNTQPLESDPIRQAINEAIRPDRPTLFPKRGIISNGLLAQPFGLDESCGLLGTPAMCRKRPGTLSHTPLLPVRSGSAGSCAQRHPSGCAMDTPIMALATHRQVLLQHLKQPNPLATSPLSRGLRESSTNVFPTSHL